MTKSRGEFHFNRNKLVEAIHAHSFGDFQRIESFIESEIRRNVMEALEMGCIEKIYKDGDDTDYYNGYSQGFDKAVDLMNVKISEVKKKWEEIG